jgi:predicted RNA-binding Zn-ribbon protein involved in translation (DUF1610 family)
VAFVEPKRLCRSFRSNRQRKEKLPAEFPTRSAAPAFNPVDPSLALGFLSWRRRLGAMSSPATSTHQVEQCVTSIPEDHEATCWGCGLRLVFASYAPVYKCGWCGAITQTDQTTRKSDSVCFSHWRRFRDRFFVTVLVLFMLFIICRLLSLAISFSYKFSQLIGLIHARCVFSMLHIISCWSIISLFSFFPFVSQVVVSGLCILLSSQSAIFGASFTVH